MRWIVICQTLAFLCAILCSVCVFRLQFYFDFLVVHFSLSPSHSRSATFFQLRQHYYCIHIRNVFSMSERTSFIINKMLTFFSLFWSMPCYLMVPVSVSISHSLYHSNHECAKATQNYTPIYLFGLFSSPFSCYCYFMVDEIFVTSKRFFPSHQTDLDELLPAFI